MSPSINIGLEVKESLLLGPEETNFLGNNISDDDEEEVPQVKKRRSRRL